MGRLRGHTGPVKCVQVEEHICLTGSEDGNIRVWDLRQVDEDDWEGGMVHLSDVVEEAEEENAEGDVVVEKPNGIRDSEHGSEHERQGASIRVLEGHSKAVTTLYFEDDTLASSLGSSDLLHPLTFSLYRSPVPRIRHFDNGTLPQDNA